MGQIVFYQTGDNIHKIDLQEISNGNYFIFVNSETSSIKKQISVLK